MIKNLLKLAFFLIVGILVYNRYMGTDAEKEQAKEVFSSVKGVVKSIGGVLKSEKSKFEAGKYDKVMAKLGDAYKSVREKAQLLDEKLIQRLGDLEDRKAALEKELEDLKADEHAEAENKSLTRAKDDGRLNASKEADKKRKQAKIQKELESLLKETETLLDDAANQ